MTPSLVHCLILYLMSSLPGINGKWVEGHVDTKENWAFLSRFCFLSFEGQFEYLIEFDRDMGIPNLLLYYDDDSQWPAVYRSSKTCKEKEAVLNKKGQNQIVKLSHWYPETEYSGCVVTRENKELPAVKSTKPTLITTTLKPINENSSMEHPQDPAYYDKFLKTTSSEVKPTVSITNSNTTEVNDTITHPNNVTEVNSTVNTPTWYELLPTDEFSTTVLPQHELWESIVPDKAKNINYSNYLEKLKDVELLFDNSKNHHKIKRSTPKRIRRRVEKSKNEDSYKVERLKVRCHNTRRFQSARERWWFIAISNCDSDKGLDVKYKFLMSNGLDGDYWHFHFSADEFYVLPVLLAYLFAYVIVMMAVVVCSVELKSRHLLHSTYKLFLLSIVAQHCGVVVQSLAYVSYASNGVGSSNARIFGQFLCGVSEMMFLLLLVLMAKGYTITRGRLKVGFTIKLTVFMCCYIVTYVVLFVYQAKMFDPGEVLYLYESPAGYGLIVLRVLGWCMFAYATFFTVKKYPQKNMFYCPFFICGTLWFFAGPLFILTANSYIDKWVRESVVNAILLFITFCGHIMFLLLTLPVFANKNFPYHVRTTQIGIMEVTGSSAIHSFGNNAYHPSNGSAQTVIIPLTRRTEELIGNMYSQYMATAAPMSIENDLPKHNGFTKQTDSLSPKSSLPNQESIETNISDDIKPYLPKDKEIFTVDSEMSKQPVFPVSPENPSMLPVDNPILPDSNKKLLNSAKVLENGIDHSRTELPAISRSNRRNILVPIKRDVPSWSLAKGPCVVSMLKKADVNGDEDTTTSPISLPRKVPPVRTPLQSSSGEISTIHEGRIQTYQNTVSKATVDLFTVTGNDKG